MPNVTYISNKQPSLAEMQKMVGGCIEVISLPGGSQLIVNDMGKLTGLEYNHEATQILRSYDPTADCIVGDAILLQGNAVLT